MLTAGYTADLAGAWNSVVGKYIGPAIAIILGAMSLKFLFSRQWTQFISFLAMGLIVAVIVFFGDKIFAQDSSLVEGAGGIATQIN